MNEVGQMALKWIFYGYQGFLYTWFLFRLLDCRFHSFSKGAAAFLCGITLFLAGIFLEPDVLYLEWESWLYLLIPLGYALLFMSNTYLLSFIMCFLHKKTSKFRSLGDPYQYYSIEIDRVFFMLHQPSALRNTICRTFKTDGWTLMENFVSS